MNITSVKCVSEDLFLDLILGMDALNDIVLDKNFIDIEVNEVDPLNFIYRRYFENVFLHRSSENVSEYLGDNKYRIRISIGEGIGILKQMLPPVFQLRARELYATTKVLVDTLEYYLTDIDTGTLELQIQKFKKAIAWNPFETASTYDVDRMKTLRSHVLAETKTGTCIDVYAYKYLSKEGFKSLYNGEVTEENKAELQCVFGYDTKRDLFSLINILEANKNIKVINVFGPDGVSFSCVEFYIDKFISSENEKLTELIKHTYSFLNMGL